MLKKVVADSSKRSLVLIVLLLLSCSPLSSTGSSQLAQRNPLNIPVEVNFTEESHSLNKVEDFTIQNIHDNGGDTMFGQVSSQTKAQTLPQYKFQARGFQNNKTYSIHFRTQNNCNAEVEMTKYKTYFGMLPYPVETRFVKVNELVNFTYGTSFNFDTLQLGPNFRYTNASPKECKFMVRAKSGITNADLGNRLIPGTVETLDYLEGYNGSYHAGVDFRASVGTSVRSTVKGVVQSVNKDIGRLSIKITNSDKYFIFLHLSKILKSKGDQVSVGDKIGESGDLNGKDAKGNYIRVTAHLHVEVRNQEFATEPLTSLTNRNGTVDPTSIF